MIVLLQHTSQFQVDARENQGIHRDFQFTCKLVLNLRNGQGLKAFSKFFEVFRGEERAGDSGIGDFNPAISQVRSFYLAGGPINAVFNGNGEQGRAALLL
jgi:hypothetical protein